MSLPGAGIQGIPYSISVRFFLFRPRFLSFERSLQAAFKSLDEYFAAKGSASAFVSPYLVDFLLVESVQQECPPMAAPAEKRRHFYQAIILSRQLGCRAALAPAKRIGGKAA